MNYERNSQDRQSALKWWKKLSELKKQEFANKYYPSWSFLMVSMSSNKIQGIWELEISLKYCV